MNPVEKNIEKSEFEKSEFGNKEFEKSELKKSEFEIERKYLVKKIPAELANYKCKKISQGYLCTSPVVRIRRSDEEYYLTYKGSGLMIRKEYNLPLTKESYEHLKEKIDGRFCVSSMRLPRLMWKQSRWREFLLIRYLRHSSIINVKCTETWQNIFMI